MRFKLFLATILIFALSTFSVLNLLNDKSQYLSNDVISDQSLGVVHNIQDQNSPNNDGKMADEQQISSLENTINSIQESQQENLSSNNNLQVHNTADMTSDSSYQPTPVPYFTPIPTPPKKYDACIVTGGTWKDYPTSCADQCGLPTNPSERICLTVLTTACDCGVNACWDGAKCVAYNLSPTITTAPTPTTAPICGNGICEVGEADIYDCPVCLDDRICPLRPCYIKYGICPKDCPSFSPYP